jgi:hypothetical protein
MLIGSFSAGCRSPHTGAGARQRSGIERQTRAAVLDR